MPLPPLHYLIIPGYCLREYSYRPNRGIAAGPVAGSQYLRRQATHVAGIKWPGIARVVLGKAERFAGD